MLLKLLIPLCLGIFSTTPVLAAADRSATFATQWTTGHTSVEQLRDGLIAWNGDLKGGYKLLSSMRQSRKDIDEATASILDGAEWTPEEYAFLCNATVDMYQTAVDTMNVGATKAPLVEAIGMKSLVYRLIKDMVRKDRATLEAAQHRILSDDLAELESIMDDLHAAYDALEKAYM